MCNVEASPIRRMEPSGRRLQGGHGKEVSLEVPGRFVAPLDEPFLEESGGQRDGI